jgi:hypothetical protein
MTKESVVIERMNNEQEERERERENLSAKVLHKIDEV